MNELVDLPLHSIIFAVLFGFYFGIFHLQSPFALYFDDLNSF